MIIELQDTIIEYSALFPPSEATFALHEIIHVAGQIPKVGPPRVNCLFMFERVNLYLKRMIKNKNCPMGSIMKAYSKEEFVTQKIGFDLTALKSLIQTIHCMPTYYNIVQRILTCFRNLHVDNENVMYSLPNCRVHELRGEDRVFSLEIQLSNSLLCALASLSRTDSVLDNVYCRYLGYMKSKNTKLRLFYNYVVNCLENEDVKFDIASEAEHHLEAVEDINKDLSILSKLSSNMSVKIYYSALIHSQLFEVPLKRGSHFE